MSDISVFSVRLRRLRGSRDRLERSDGEPFGATARGQRARAKRARGERLIGELLVGKFTGLYRNEFQPHQYGFHSGRILKK